MPIMLEKLYVALRAANIPDDAAKAAAVEAAEQQLTLTKIATEMMFHRWAFALIIALHIGILVKLFAHS